jgi:BirA family biotin operon repressor/biotin-[acetyl-CoA-carboxylase] ligase
MSTIHPDLKATLLNSNLYIPYKPVFVKKQTTSTNEDAKKLSITHDALVIVAESQSKGKGRYERSFQSNPHKGIYLSFIMKAKLDSALLAKLSLISPLALALSIDEHTHLKAQIKWPNDLLIHQKKVAGILIETQSNQSRSTDTIIIGIGLNVYHQDFSVDIAQSAASLEDFTDADIDRNTLIISFFKHFDQLFHSSTYIELYRQWMLVKGTQVQVINQTESYIASIDSIDEEGRLIVSTNTAKHTLLAEEIRIVLL